MQQRLDQDPQAMRRRRETVEHPFGTLKMRMGATHFLMKTKRETRMPTTPLRRFCRQLSARQSPPGDGNFIVHFH